MTRYLRFEGFRDEGDKGPLRAVNYPCIPNPNKHPSLRTSGQGTILRDHVMSRRDKGKLLAGGGEEGGGGRRRGETLTLALFGASVY